MEIQLGEYEVLEDMLIDGLKIVQDTRLYRFTSDSVLLSRFAKGKKKDKVADFCAGSGIVAFHFYALNKPKIKSVTLFEMQESLHKLALKTVALNNFDVFTCENVRLQDIPPKYVENFSLVLCNPPYERGGLENACYEKAVCRKEITLTLAEIAAAGSRALKFGGRLCLLHRADRVAEVCYTLHEHNLEVKRLQFVAGKDGDKPYLILVEAVKGGKPAVQLLPTLINQK
jgi:tRNA1(Val) A37 N6-methylase TrmN6